MTPDRVATRLGPLPADWSVRPLGEVTEKTASPIDVQPRGLYREIGIRSHGKGVFHKEPVKGETLGAKRVFRILPDRLVFNIVFAWEGAVAVTSTQEEGMIASHRFPMFAPSEARLIDVEFLRRFFQTELGVRLLGDASPGGAGRNRTLNQKFAAEIPVPVPPLGEQRKIAAILASVDDAIGSTQAVIDQLGIVKQAMMAELLTRGLPGRHTRFKQTKIGEVPEQWTLGVIEALGPQGEPTVRTGPFGSSMKTKDFRSSGLPVLTIQSLGHGAVLRDGLFFVDDAKARELAEYKVRVNDVVFSRVADIGRCVAIGESESGWLISPNLSRIRLDPAKADAHFVMSLLTLGPAVIRQVEAVAGNAGRPVITSTTLKALTLAVPDLDEQRAIAHAARAIETRILAESATLAQLTQAKAALMSVLLTGEVRVKPDEETTA